MKLIVTFCVFLFGLNAQADTSSQYIDDLRSELHGSPDRYDNGIVEQSSPTITFHNRSTSLDVWGVPAISLDGSSMLYSFSENSCCVNTDTELLHENIPSGTILHGWTIYRSIDFHWEEGELTTHEARAVYASINSALDLDQFISLVPIENYRVSLEQGSSTVLFFFDGTLIEISDISNPVESILRPFDDEGEQNPTTAEIILDIEAVSYSPDHSVVMLTFLHYSAGNWGDAGPVFQILPVE